MDLPHKQRAFFPFSDLKKYLNNKKEVRLDIRQTCVIYQQNNETICRCQLRLDISSLIAY